MKQITLLATLLAFVISGCAGLPLPFTEFRLGEFLIESDRKETNSTCTDLATLNSASVTLETQHLIYLQTSDPANAITVTEVKSVLGEACQTRFTRLSTPQIKTELFGDIQTISDSSKLRELGGISFAFRNTVSRSGIEPTFHLRKRTEGPKRRLVAIYTLSDGKVIHFNYSGTDNVDTKSRFWPIREFFGIAIKGGTKAIGIPF
jgi:hypothetical protein